MKEPAFEFGDAVAGGGGLFEGEASGLFVHFLFEADDFGFQALGVAVLRLVVGRSPFGHLARSPAHAGVGAFHDIEHRFADAGGSDVVFAIELQLPFPAAVGFVDRPLHRAGDLVGIEYGLAVQVARRTADGLDQRAVRTQEAFLVGIENRPQVTPPAYPVPRAAG